MNNDPNAPYPPQQPAAPQPVAYDAQGRPLYAHPPVMPPPAPQQPHYPPQQQSQPQQQQSQPQPAQTQPDPNQAQQSTDQQPQPTVVHVARPLEPVKQEMSPETKKLHDRSKRAYPFLNLSEGEYVIRAVRRHPIGLILPLGAGTLVIGLALAFLFNYDLFSESLATTTPLPGVSAIVLPVLILVGIVSLGMFISYYVYVNNKFFLTNESVIQEIQISLFSRKEQTVSLSNIEDASFTQLGVMQQIFDYGDIRLSTEGDETTYRFSYVASPKNHIERLNNAVEAFKNGRPVQAD